MKKNLFLWAAFAVMMALAGCTQTEIVYVEKEDGTGSEMQLEGNVLKISMSNSLTRTARPIKDNTAANNINRIQLRFFDGNKDELSTISIKSVNNNLNYDDNVITINNDCPEVITVELDMDQDKDKNVYIFAYGYNVEGDESPLELTKNNFEANAGNILLDNQFVTNSVNLQEYFAGSIFTYINKYGLFNESPEVTLKRQVAGLLVYLENIPAVLNDNSGVQKDVKYITVNAAMTVTGLVMPAEGIYRDGNQTERGKDGRFANGYTQNKATLELLRFDLTNAGRNPNNNLSYNNIPGNSYGQQVIFANGMTESNFSGMKFAKNTLFGSCFILPFASLSYDYITGHPYTALYISYLDADEQVINTALLNMSTGSSSSQMYSIWANHFYSIGTKIGDADGDADGDGYPDTDEDGDGNPDEEDDPLDIGGETGTRALILKVDDMWEDVTLIRPTE